MQEIKWDKIQGAAVENLKAVIRFDTTNPPGNELAAARFIEAKLKESGIKTKIFEPAQNRANLVARLPGEDKAPPLMLEGHLDVVPAESDKWSLPPFSADEKNGALYGRGAVDMKNMVAMSLTAMLALKELDVTPKRDVIFVATADEETGGRLGSQYLVENHKELVQAEYMLGEVGGFSVYQKGGKTVYPVGVAEKGLLWVRLKASGEPGHGSIPHSNNAVLKLASALAKIAERGLPLHITPVASDFVKELAKAQPFPNSRILPLLLVPYLSERILKLLPEENRNQFNAMLRNTVTPTVLAGGIKTNVIPSSASVELDMRILPGFDKEDVLRELRGVIGNELSVEELSYSPPPKASGVNSELFGAIRKTIERNDPGAVVAPYLIPGYTDARWFSTIGVVCYGFVPLKLDPNDKTPFGKLFHGHDERIWIEGFKWGMKTFMETLLEFLA
ncbi:MAG: M20/M25/M40 family metallo-hydrolase [Myxococcota bacterium]